MSKNKELRVAQVRFEEGYGKLYDYWCDMPSVKVGDTLFVIAQGKVKLVKCERIKETSDKAYKFILGRVDVARLADKSRKYETIYKRLRNEKELKRLEQEAENLEYQIMLKKAELSNKQDKMRQLIMGEMPGSDI